MINNKKGQSLSMNVIIIAILSLMVLMLISFMFVHKLQTMNEEISNSPQNVSIVSEHVYEYNCTKSNDMTNGTDYFVGFIISDDVTEQIYLDCSDFDYKNLTENLNRIGYDDMIELNLGINVNNDGQYKLVISTLNKKVSE